MTLGEREDWLNQVLPQADIEITEIPSPEFWKVPQRGLKGKRVNHMPLLSSGNQYALLEVDSVEDDPEASPDPTNETTTAPDVQPTHTTIPSSPIHLPCLPHWEWRLPRKYVVASTPSENSLHLKVEIVTTDTQQLISSFALLDCRATGLFMDRGFVDRNRITTRTLSHPIPVYNVDRTLNKAGSICEVVDVVLCYKDHFKWVQFTVTGLRNQDTILGYTWLKEHNPEVLHTCHAGPMPTVEKVFEDTPELYPDTEDDGDDDGDDADNAEAPDEIEEGDRIIMTTVYCYETAKISR
jgi:hypothetical protein